MGNDTRVPYFYYRKKNPYHKTLCIDAEEVSLDSYYSTR